jgi:transposase
MLLIESEMPVSKVSDCVGATAPRIWRVFDYWIARAVANDRLSEVKRIGMDETSRKKGHRYVTQFVDLDARRTIFVTEGKDASTVDAFVEELEKGAEGKKASSWLAWICQRRLSAGRYPTCQKRSLCLTNST